MCSGICIKYLPFHHGNRTSQQHQQRSSYHSHLAAGSQAQQSGCSAQSAQGCREGWAGPLGTSPPNPHHVCPDPALASLLPICLLISYEASSPASLFTPSPSHKNMLIPSPRHRTSSCRMRAPLPPDTPEAGLQVQTRPCEWQQHSTRVQMLPGPLNS